MDLPGRTVDCISLWKQARRPTTERAQQPATKARAQSLRSVTVHPGCLQRSAKQRDVDTRSSSSRTISSRLQNKSLLTDMNNLGLPSASSEATTTREERHESLRSDHRDVWLIDRSGVQRGDEATKSDTKEGATRECCKTCLGSLLRRSDRLQPSWTASRLMAKTVILAAIPGCHLVVVNYGRAYGLLQLPGSARLSGGESCKHQARTNLSQRIEAASTNPSQGSPNSQTSWLDCPNPLLLLAASMAEGSLILSYRQLNATDEFQTKILIAFVCVGMAFGFCCGQSLLATVLGILPLAVYAGLGFSDLLHNGRKRWMIRKTDMDGIGGWTDGVYEKV